MKKKIHLLSGQRRTPLTLLVSAAAYERLRRSDSPVEEINLDIRRFAAGQKPHVLNAYQIRLVGSFFGKDNTGPFNRVDLGTYMITATCGASHAPTHYTGGTVLRRDGTTPVEWVHDHRVRLTLPEANAELLRYACQIAGRALPHWGTAARNLHGYARGTADCGTRDDGTRWLRDNTVTYSVTKEKPYK